MYRQWIDEILSTKVLPEYEFSPFPRDTLYEDSESDSSAVTPSISITIAIISVITTILKSLYTSNN